MQIQSIGIPAVLALLPPESRAQLASISVSVLLNSEEGAILVKRLIHAVLRFYEGNPMSVLFPRGSP